MRKKISRKRKVKPASSADSRPAFPAGQFPVVGIGASAGGLEDFEKFFRHMPSRTGTAFILVAHLEPDHASLLPEILQRSTQMPVVQAKNRVRVEPDHVYIIPPNMNMEIFGGVLRLIEMKKNVMKTPISHFFSSLAMDQKERAFAVLLSGMGSDGTVGAEEVKHQGGTVIAEDPSLARYDAMPASAIRSGTVDFILPVEKMPEQIIHYSRTILPERQKGRLGPEVLRKIFSILRQGTGHDFSSYKRNTIFRRLERRMNALKISKIDGYLRYLENHPGEVSILFKEMLIGVTSFFRDAEAFNAIRKKVLPLLFQNKPDGYTARLWVPACSTGEEAYSLAILISEYMRQTGQEYPVQIFATDIDDDAVEYSRHGVYPESIAEAVPRDLLKRYFIKKGNFYQVEKSVREKIIFAPQNLIKDPPFTRLDLVSCRNLLIYLDAELQDRLLPLFHYVLKPDGILILGPSETIGGYMDLFVPLEKKWKIYRRKGGVFVPQPVLSFPFTRSERYVETEHRLKKPRGPEFQELIDKFLMEKYSPQAVVVNEKGDIFYIHGKTGKFLELAPGTAKMNLFEMARDDLRFHLVALVRKAAQEKKEVRQRDISIRTDGGSATVNVVVRPFVTEKEMQGLLLVLFDEPLLAKESAIGKKTTENILSTGTKREQELYRELQDTRSRLQTSIEELETSNEELKSTNEEYQSTNEELKSANEELETSREEMQSLNEELVTVNTELQGKVDELSHSHKEMKNFLDNLEIPIIVLDNDGRIVRFTSHAKNLINLIDSDVGRPLSHISSNLKFPDLVEQAAGVLRSSHSRETEVETSDGRWYLMRILPYRTNKNFTEGVVMIFVDITKIKSLGIQLSEIKKLKAGGKEKK